MHEELKILINQKPSLYNLSTWEKSYLFDPLVEVIKDFYKDPKNRQDFEQWIANGKPMKIAKEMNS
ncbi:MAG: hypothetical protein FWE45_03395 [Firmicutes bacterium]|nr:hypothetical protein [Bacillota bacterium]